VSEDRQSSCRGILGAAIPRRSGGTSEESEPAVLLSGSVLSEDQSGSEELPLEIQSSLPVIVQQESQYYWLSLRCWPVGAGVRLGQSHEQPRGLAEQSRAHPFCSLRCPTSRSSPQTHGVGNRATVRADESALADLPTIRA